MKKTGGALALMAGIVLILFCYVVVGIGLDKVAGYIDVPCIAITIFPTLAAVMIIAGAANFISVWKVIFSGKAKSVAELSLAATACSASWKVSIVGGLMGLAIGFINVSSFSASLGDFTGKTWALIVLPLFYSLLWMTLFIPLQLRLESAAKILVASLGNTDAGECVNE